MILQKMTADTFGGGSPLWEELAKILGLSSPTFAAPQTASAVVWSEGEASIEVSYSGARVAEEFRACPDCPWDEPCAHPLVDHLQAVKAPDEYPQVVLEAPIGHPIWVIVAIAQNAALARKVVTKP